jgi:1-deoxy-D-xylulose-5-phosphate synthase
MLVNARFVKPLDMDLLRRLGTEGYDLITVEEGQTAAGFGSAVLEFFAAEHMDGIKVFPIGLPDQFIEHGSIQELRDEVSLTAEHIVSEVISRMPRSRQRA